ncbi:MAG TPA: STAS-like domain-containing protein [Leptolyngbyaceae cyanobacterium]
MSLLKSCEWESGNKVKIVVAEVIGDNLCIASEDGRKVYEKIANAFKEGKKAIVSFQDAEDVTSAFLAEAIGHLYAEFPEQQIASCLNVVDIEPDDAADLEDTIFWVKKYLEDPEKWEAAAREAFGEYYFDE